MKGHLILYNQLQGGGVGGGAATVGGNCPKLEPPSPYQESTCMYLRGTLPDLHCFDSITDCMQSFLWGILGIKFLSMHITFPMILQKNACSK